MSFLRRGPVLALVPPHADEAIWALAENDVDGQSLLLRRNLALETWVGHPQYGHQAGIAVPLAPVPSVEELARLDAFEDVLVDQVSADGRSLLAAVITAGTMREFVLYTREPRALPAIVDRLALEFPDLDAQLMVQPDPDWDVYRALAGS